MELKRMRAKQITTLVGLAAVAGATAWSTASNAQDKGWSPIENFPTLRTASYKMTPRERADYIETVQKTANMVHDGHAQRLVSKTGLQIMNLTWEDTGRYKNSAVGPNISDMTIQVTVEDGRQVRTELMPVIRFPNFSDKTGDIDPSAFTLLVGNEDGRPLKRVSLYDFLDDPSRYLHDPKSWAGRARDKTLLA
ncbi:MAG: hypothetical protein IH945_05480, partial [Armatimonadetes bacterium]|nr:hypothetical protein [Armatimonadota bacterium]